MNPNDMKVGRYYKITHNWYGRKEPNLIVEVLETSKSWTSIKLKGLVQLGDNKHKTRRVETIKDISKSQIEDIVEIKKEDIPNLVGEML